MITLEKAILQAEKVAEDYEYTLETGMVDKDHDYTISEFYCDDTEVIEEHLNKFRQYAEDNRQLATWLKHYKKLLETQEPCEDAISRRVFEQVMWERDVAIEQLKELGYGLGEKPKTGHWIPVSEKLPDSEGLYLVSVRNEHERRYSKTCWFDGHRNWFARQDVVAWMPLPEPYEPRGSEDEQ